MKDKWYINFSHIFMSHFKCADVRSTSVLIAYYFLLSIFPLLIAVGNILAFLDIDITAITSYLRVVIPSEILNSLIQDLISTSSGGLLSFGILAAIWSSSRGITYMQRGVNKAYGVSPRGNFVIKKAVSLLIIVLIALFLIAFLILFSFGNIIFDSISQFVPRAHTISMYLTDLKWPISCTFLFSLTLLVYFLTPHIKVHIRNVWPGAVFASAGLLGLVQGFTLYLRFFAQRYTSYSTLGTFAVLMLWLHFSAMFFLLGAVLNASIQEYRYGKITDEISRMDTLMNSAQQKLINKVPLIKWILEKQQYK